MEPRRVPFSLKIEAGQHTIEAETSIPDTPMRVTDLLPILMSFDNALVEMGADRLVQEGKTITCRAGCGACCRQLVPVSEAEVRWIAELVAGMPEPQQSAVRARFREALAALGDDMVSRLRDTTQYKDIETRRQLGEEYMRLGVPCPFLVEESCSIHPNRPMSCLEYLVTSPAEGCKNPGPDTIEPVPMPVKLSGILYCFSDGIGNQSTRWFPLVMALEWEAAHRDEPQHYFPGPQLFKNFVAQISRREKEQAEPPAPTAE